MIPLRYYQMLLAQCAIMSPEYGAQVLGSRANNLRNFFSLLRKTPVNTPAFLAHRFPQLTLRVNMSRYLDIWT